MEYKLLIDGKQYGIYKTQIEAEEAQNKLKRRYPKRKTLLEVVHKIYGQTFSIKLKEI